MLLRAVNIYKSYAGLEVLKGICIEVQPAEVVSITGSSGSGKSTLLHILGTLDQPDQGEVFFEQKDVNRIGHRRLSQLRNEQMGFVFQFHNLLPEFTAEENVAMPALIRGEKARSALERAADLLEHLGVGHRRRHEPSRLSGGEAQRVAVARALINRPKLVLADEPSGNLDEQNARLLHELFLQLRDTFGTAFVIVTHHRELARLADRGFYLHTGKLIQEWQANSQASFNTKQQPSGSKSIK